MLNKYVLKFKKEGYIKYISHLDLMRLFNRCFKMADLDLAYSFGFNPHPKFSFVQPLSLGYSSLYELLEFELKEDIQSDIILSRMNSILPEGITVTDCIKYYENDSLTGLVISCKYNVMIPFDISKDNFDNTFSSYINRDNIIVNKKTKKGDIKEINIKPMIREYNLTYISSNCVILTLNLNAGSISNLSPELVIDSFLKFSRISTKRYDIEVERVKIETSNNFHF